MHNPHTASLSSSESNGIVRQPSFRQAYMSALLLLGMTGSTSAASAHPGIPTPPVPAQTNFGGHPVFVGHSSPSSTATHSSGSAIKQSVWQSPFTTLLHKNSSQTSVAPTLTGSGALNLSSAAQNFTATQIGSFDTVTLDLGGKQVAFHLNGSGAQMTSAELVSAAQIAAGGHQTLTLDSQGQAVGGSIQLNQKTLTNLDTFLGGSVSSLLIPQKVILVDKLSSLSLSGDLVNYGKIQTVASTAPGGDIISAADTYNQTGASISAGKSSDLTLVDSQSLINSGLITAGSNLFVNSANVANSGALTASKNITFNTSQQLSLNNTSGLIQASNNVNVRDASYNGANGVSITGWYYQLAATQHI